MTPVVSGDLTISFSMTAEFIWEYELNTELVRAVVCTFYLTHGSKGTMKPKG